MGDAGHQSHEDGRALGWLLVAGQFALIAAILLAPGGPALGASRLGLVAGGLAVLAGLGLAGWGALSLGPALTPHPAPRPGAPLVRHGAYRLTSHPIYMGLGIAGVGIALLRDSTVALLLAGTLATLLWAKAGYETRLLRRAHPGALDRET